jgi:hypothetical protein
MLNFKCKILKVDYVTEKNRHFQNVQVLYGKFLFCKAKLGYVKRNKTNYRLLQRCVTPNFITCSGDEIYMGSEKTFGLYQAFCDCQSEARLQSSLQLRYNFRALYLLFSYVLSCSNESFHSYT